ncbi:dihydrodipicolinate reductase [Thalassococcus profundi]|uniref:Dihydrodipicolinate reductase n=1 Tax=Thalassococcus profundi TaxID=2282382 RepID=A0A369TTR8_9RHOB|nr:dihydrodipicolinate reductase [Thalassococcus profundi]RDD67547.1 dihydrodipicolinate reductase [Thalassococcus profundi]
MSGLRTAAMAALVVLTTTGPALAEFEQVTDRAQFIKLIAGKTLSRTLVELWVSPNGGISGNGAGWDVTGSWSWKDGYFCRDLNWGGDELGYNCQAVHSDGSRIRFTSDRGDGQSAAFTLR